MKYWQLQRKFKKNTSKQFGKHMKEKKTSSISAGTMPKSNWTVQGMRTNTSGSWKESPQLQKESGYYSKNSLCGQTISLPIWHIQVGPDNVT